ncbi:putative endonuclease [Mesonia algae]|uniref:Putative endonuclease n=1 Tax=Mesonia algae TaxID=213248 RepID=A0A2W7I698_9FLAO|nr:GIY-YIG nuclease family protein [Mesonia algae]PZW42411.1 putative endonuclease [Mesonia algae]
MKTSYVYIMTNEYRTTLYIGVTSNLSKRITEHQLGKASLFTAKYNLKYLIYFEEFLDIQEAIKREKQLKSWKKNWKIDLVKKLNPELKTIELT